MASTRKRLTNQAGGYKNAMTPLNWFVGIAQTALMSGVILSTDVWVKIVCVILVVSVLSFYGYVYHFFMKKDPDRLQTEEYNLIAQEMTLLNAYGSEVPAVKLSSTEGQIIETSMESAKQISPSKEAV